MGVPTRDGRHSQAATRFRIIWRRASPRWPKQSVRIYGSGRTDTGVHALGQVAHFDVPDGLSMNAYNWLPAVNSKLPPAIRVMDCEEVPKDFHARFGAVTKTYTYDLCLAPVLPPLSAGSSMAFASPARC